MPTVAEGNKIEATIYTYTDKTTLKCDKEFDGKGAGDRRVKEKRGGEDG